ncbi:cyclic nucleotide-binding domain-containing protein [Aeromicrobium sp. YIM 150415]|uniref:Cyclic nucleotide-binding domain-containing protein n=1 Tax=Aeromicrobium piscarium TaxID=2590901 RepID=A0A554SPV5_9ACTN|nr:MULTISPECIES: cyclic nucleotide-binding domain-containing protein [Aeromicrobium]MBM9462163.1 cyclic nucleotide-binding domain-containing protein [Aeromicrobium sp. YIM 150415]TSD68376.1 cyclic nucleotide-binding domain-containing protein [Aeromicrobium piscarium]
MARKSDADVVSALQRLTDFDDATIKALASTGQTVHIPANWAMIFEHQPADKAYILLDGSVEIRKDGGVVATLQPGDVVGEIALVTGRLRSATVVTTTDVQALHFTAEAFEQLAAHNPAFAEALRDAAKHRIEG